MSTLAGPTGSSSSIQMQTVSQSNDGDIGDLTELRLLEWCNLNKYRLGAVLNGKV